MPLRPIIILPDKRLRLVARPVASVDSEVRALMDDMLETMYEAPGIGLAATQIAVDRRVIVLDVAKRRDDSAKADPICLANPEILWASEELSSYEEGCLSIPEFYEEVFRPEKVRVGYLDRDGRRREIEADGLLATCLQHEIDHLNGVLFIDHISRLKRARIIKKFEKAAKLDAQEPKRAPHSPHTDAQKPGAASDL
ncbi:peptide deformylase [Methylocella silvestris BL2]|uniref:Peptide deformylase n=1 Tax=Methylocella silvestris (strain DSM 15510 / CIP 108128 / LMG 27833 / NCIMB 13906 / BL2) TaxID=395965 RepID=DEF_METSB|nr:peptide deformylase [Methylocella silvestris]B8ENG6.1 RecName: Full=Peptide deformylase; Short=PDF; AltName: Full=Polypeptide deformylase [Methylocella silvestris BL2]ACK50097.1 peptide deformylase [Methylocella silvestris BL2]